MPQLAQLRNRYPAGNFEILAFYCRQFGGGSPAMPTGGALYGALAATVPGGNPILPFKVFGDGDNQIVGNGACDVYQWL